MEEIIESNPEKIFLMIGINDIGNGLTIDEIIENYTQILDYIQEESPDTQIYIQSVLPCNSELMEDNQRNANRTTENISELNEKLCNFSGAAYYIDLFSNFLNENNELDEKYTVDGVHLSQAGYELWSSIIEEYLYE